jgi:DNA-directed RNA polymerase specialized sigma24 family protein
VDRQEDITAWIGRLKEGDDRAAEAIWQQYFDKLVRLARRKLEGMPRRAVDEEDVALSAINSFCARAADDRFARLNDRHDLWKLLVTITARKALAQQKRHRTQKRGGGNVRGDSIFMRPDDDRRDAGMAQVLGSEPSPELAAMVAETCKDLLERLGDESLQTVARLKMEGYSNDEIAGQLNCTTRTVERKLNLIRSKWTPESA